MKSFQRSLFISCATVLGHKYRDGCGTAVSEGIGKSFDPGGRRICGNDLCSAGVYRSLDQHLSNVNAGLVKCRHSTEIGCSLQKRQIHPHIFPAEEENGMFFPHDPQTYACGKKLGDHSCQSGSGSSHMQSRYKSNIQCQIHAHGNKKSPQRRFRISGSPEHCRAPVIKEGGRKSDKNDLKISHNIRIQNQKAYNTQNNGKAPSRAQRKEAFFSKFFIIFLPVEFCKNNGHSITSTIEDKDKQVHDTACNANACKGFCSHISSHNKRIYGVVKLLQDISQYQRNGQCDQFTLNISMQQILRIFHFSASFSYLFQKNSIPIRVSP